MTDTPIDLDAIRRARRPSYVDSDRINEGCDEIERAVERMTVESVNIFGTPDLMTFEILAHVNAIRRILGELT